jgi:hypothetical protein
MTEIETIEGDLQSAQATVMLARTGSNRSRRRSTCRSQPWTRSGSTPIPTCSGWPISSAVWKVRSSR